MEARSMYKLTALLSNDGTITVKEFLDWYRDYYRPENNFLLRIRLEDWIWLKSHITDGTYFESGKDTDRITKILPCITGIRKDIDIGIVINFIKAIYAIYQNRETFFEASLQKNVDLIFDTIYCYVREDTE